MLDDVPGLGEVRRKTLLRHFGSLKKLRPATVDEIAGLPGFGRRTAEAVVGRGELRGNTCRHGPCARGQHGHGRDTGRREPTGRPGQRRTATERRTSRGADNLIIVSGMSGAGRVAVADVLEDLGWFVVDNLPPMLLASMVEQTIGDRDHPARGRAGRPDRAVLRVAADPALPSCGSTAYRPVTLFLEASDDVIVRRQESVRRPHPLQGEGRLLDGIQREREMLRDLRAVADLVIDTSNLNVHQLGAKVVQRVRRRPTTTSCGRPWCRSGSSTASRSTPTWWPTCGSCPTRTGTRTCGT